MINCLWFGLLFLLFFGTRPDQTALPLFGVLDWVAPTGSFEQFVVLLIQKRHLTDTSLSSEPKTNKINLFGSKELELAS